MVEMADEKKIKKLLQEKWGNMRRFGFDKKDWEDIKALSKKLSPLERLFLASIEKVGDKRDVLPF